MCYFHSQYIWPCKLYKSKKIPFDGFDTFLSEMSDFWGLNEKLIAIYESTIYILQKTVSISGTEATVCHKYSVEDVKGTRIKLGRGGFLTIVWKDELELPDLCLIMDIEDGSDIIEKIKVNKKQLSAAPLLATVNTHASNNRNQDSSNMEIEPGDVDDLMKQFDRRDSDDVSGSSVDVSDLMKEYNNDGEGAHDLQINPSTW